MNAANRDGDTALHWAVRYGSLDRIVEILIERAADLNRFNKAGNAPLHLTSNCKSTAKELTEILIGADADINLRSKVTLETPLLRACQAGADGVDAAAVLIKAKADVGPAGLDDETPLLLAARRGSLETYKALLRAKAAVTRGGGRPFGLGEASRFGRLEVVSVLLEAKARPTDTGQQGRPVLELAALGLVPSLAPSVPTFVGRFDSEPYSDFSSK